MSTLTREPADAKPAIAAMLNQKGADMPEQIDLLQRIARIEKVAEQQRQKIEHMRKTITGLSKTQTRHGMLLKAVDKTGATEILADFTDRMKYLSARLQVAIAKDCVLTEVSRIYPELYTQIVRAFDESDEWWRAGESLSLNGWATRISKLRGANLMPDDASPWLNSGSLSNAAAFAEND